MTIALVLACITLLSATTYVHHRWGWRWAGPFLSAGVAIAAALLALLPRRPDTPGWVAPPPPAVDPPVRRTAGDILDEREARDRARARRPDRSIQAVADDLGDIE